ncbi:hypothetical protein [Spiroplasma endosymbiont of Megaselia nigra]|uniref:hypothetical protein n=1 Tax=Spiroplasma endosymbiont of Megaselia nigra TaxID=2478537 RepID=UPI000F86EF0F|nr:hypothetical protein [Spiroplasma endosymbiont of Megaselia nigra]RUO85883.1 hypothetical protein D9R21_06230 [Spiroplasma endosymbiont of Megaselia nigra]
MKRILIILKIITLIGTSTVSLVACNETKYNQTQLQELKEQNKINTKDGILEWIAPQEKPFNQIDDKYYFVVWRSNSDDGWRIIKFLNDTDTKKVLDNYGRYKLIFKEYSPFYDFTLLIRGERGDPDYTWKTDDGTYFKFLYRWNNNDKNVPNLVVDYKTGEVKEVN